MEHEIVKQNTENQSNQMLVLREKKSAKLINLYPDDHRQKKSPENINNHQKGDNRFKTKLKLKKLEQTRELEIKMPLKKHE